MGFVSSNEHSISNDPGDPLYYAPRGGRGASAPRSNATPQTRSDHSPPPSRSRFDEMREEAFAKSKQHSLEFQFVRERRSARALLAVGGGIAAAIGVAVIVALVFSNTAPRLESNPSDLAVSISTPASARPAQTTTEDSHGLLQGFVQFQQSQGHSPEHAAREPTSAGPAKETPEKSQALLEKFIQWQQINSVKGQR